MSIANGVPANATNFNNAFASKTADNTLSGLLELARVASGATISDTQKLLIQIIDALGVTGLDDADRKVYSSHQIIASGDTRKVAIGKLDAALKLVQTAVNQGLGMSSLRWYAGDTGPSKTFYNGHEYWAFNQTDSDSVSQNQEIHCMIKVPSTYSTGQLFLKKGLIYSATISGNVLFRAKSQIMRGGIDSASASGYHTSTNVEQAINGTTGYFSTLNDLDLTDSSGQIDSTTVLAGDTIKVIVYRDNVNATSNVDDDVKLVVDSFEARFA